MKAGASDFLEKPCSDRALLGAVEATFEAESRVAGDRRERRARAD
jgi:two-component system, LuxR family, response regulator FixJ